MKIKKSIFIFSIFLFILCKNPQSPELWSDESDGIRFRIWTDKSSYQEGEDIWLFVEFENISSEAKVILISPQQQPMPEKAPLYDIEKIIIQVNSRDSSSTLVITPAHSSMFYIIPDLLKLLPDQIYQEKAKLNSGFWYHYHERYERDPFTYLEPGKYGLRAIYTWDELPYSTPEREKLLEQLGAQLWKGYLESNKINITVTSKN